MGASHPVKVDVRVLSATHQPLIDRVAAGTFRADLFARLSGFSFQVPPLRVSGVSTSASCSRRSGEAPRDPFGLTPPWRCLPTTTP